MAVAAILVLFLVFKPEFSMNGIYYNLHPSPTFVPREAIASDPVDLRSLTVYKPYINYSTFQENSFDNTLVNGELVNEVRWFQPDQEVAGALDWTNSFDPFGPQKKMTPNDPFSFLPMAKESYGFKHGGAFILAPRDGVLEDMNLM